MNFSQITFLDMAVIVGYLLVMFAIGVIFVKDIKGLDDYYVAGRSLGPVVLMATVCATTVGGSAMMGRAGIGYTNGVECVITAVPYILGMIVFSCISGRIQRVGFKYGVKSIPDLFDKRFGKVPKCILSAMIAFAMTGTVAAQVTATATIVKMLGGQFGISYEMGALIATIVFLCYTASSGLFGVVYTDVIQFFMMVLFVYIAIPVASTIHVGGLGVFWENLDTSYLVPRVDGNILGDIVTYLVYTMAGAEMWQRAFAAKTPKIARRGMLCGTIVYSIMIVLVLFIGLLAQQILPDVYETYGSTDAVIPALAVTMLPAGITGLSLAGILSALMSTSDSYLLVSMQAVVHDIGKTIFPGITEKQEIRYSRIVSVFISFGALFIALYIKSAYDVLMFAWSFYATAAGLPAVAALFWKKATSSGIMAGMIGGFATTVGWKLAGTPFGIGETVPGAIVCAVLLVSVSLATYKKRPSKILEP